MQAVRFVGVGRPAQIEDVPEPSPGPGQVMIRITTDILVTRKPAAWLAAGSTRVESR
jgi:hypothetical protein